MGNKHDAKSRRKGGPNRFKKRRFHSNRSTKLIDSTLSVEQMETTADITPVTSAMHRKLTINNDNNLLFQSSPGSCSSDDHKLPFHYLFLDSSILKIFCQLLVHAQYVASLRN